MLTTCTMPIESQNAGERGAEAGDETAKWYAAYTRPGYENRVACSLQARAIPFYLPTYQRTCPSGHAFTNRRHGNRTLPLLPGSIFVRMPWIDRALILGLPGVISLLTGWQYALPFPDFEIETLQANLSQVHARPHPYLHTGIRVSIQSGPLSGLTGLLQQQDLRVVVVLSFPAMSRSIAVVADGWELKRL